MKILVLPDREVSIGTVGLDVDGVLRNTGYAAFEAVQATIAELGGRVPNYAEFVRDLQGDFVGYYASCGVVASLEEIKEVYFRHLPPHDDVEPFADVVPFLRDMEESGVKVFVVSSHPEDQLHDWFVRHGIRDHFLHVAGGSRNKQVCIGKACQTLGVSPAAALYVGDWGMDMRAARTAGLLPVGITRRYPSAASLRQSGAAHVVEHLLQLPWAVRP